ncbi:hypothetical protein, partial [Sansalvadorimonas verongulae]|uniref:hypothetical protein n=1 Tax=Sansalvadorimonas verongulae TaxID=2172824 RepID=UPI0012BC17E7
MKVIDTLRTHLADFIESHSRSSQIAGTYLNRLVQFIRPEHHIRSYTSQPNHKPHFIPLSERHAAHHRATHSVRNLEARIQKDLAQKADAEELDVEHIPEQQTIGQKEAIKYGFKMIEKTRCVTFRPK